jgi:hypothetical protein
VFVAACQFIAATLEFLGHLGVSFGMPHKSFCKGLIATGTLANACFCLMSVSSLQWNGMTFFNRFCLDVSW